MRQPPKVTVCSCRRRPANLLRSRLQRSEVVEVSRYQSHQNRLSVFPLDKTPGARLGSQLLHSQPFQSSADVSEPFSGGIDKAITCLGNLNSLSLRDAHGTGQLWDWLCGDGRTQLCRRRLQERGLHISFHGLPGTKCCLLEEQLSVAPGHNGRA